MDWTSSMQQSFEYYIVDPITWADDRKLDYVISASIERDSSSETIETASFEMNEVIGESYIRAYLVCTQNGITEKFSLGTFLAQTPSESYDGKTTKITMDAYSPLIELKDNLVPMGYYLPVGSNIMDYVSSLTASHMRGPVTENTSISELLDSDFVANLDDTWLEYLRDLIAKANYEFELDGYGRTQFGPIKEPQSLSPVWTFTDDNSSILYPEMEIERDLYGIPNVIEVYAEWQTYGKYLMRAKNNNEASPTSIQARGREIVKRITDPSIPKDIPIDVLARFANDELKKASTVEYTITYKHGYCPVRIGDCVRLNYSIAGLNNVKAKVIKQSINCSTGCEVSETAVYTRNLLEA